ncbi:hypothetical protein [Aneurinibacillus tyrosinisolvens]|jgi:hypothetical protein|nr:hypothetical protein [Aneurinibacillus tyrosinisolvens]
MKDKTPITKMPSDEAMRRYFEFIINAGIPERVAQNEQGEEQANGQDGD